MNDFESGKGPRARRDVIVVPAENARAMSHLSGVRHELNLAEEGVARPMDVINFAGTVINDNPELLLEINTVEDYCIVTERMRASGMPCSGLLWGHSLVDWRRILEDPKSRMLVCLDQESREVLGFFNYFLEGVPDGFEELLAAVPPTTLEGNRVCFADTAAISPRAAGGVYTNLTAAFVQRMREYDVDLVIDICRIDPVPNEALAVHLRMGWQPIVDPETGEPIKIKMKHRVESSKQIEEAEFVLLAFYPKEARHDALLDRVADGPTRFFSVEQNGQGGGSE